MAMDPSDPSLEDVLDAIKEGSKKSDVIAERIDDHGSNDPITARMLKAIEEAEFVVVDLTYMRPNVFYEAGYAQGLGKTPIYLARQGTEIPFDVKDYPVILYPNMRELKILLAERLNDVRRGRE
jgi:nucleoside 2-deoxyribosyltransferase